MVSPSDLNVKVKFDRELFARRIMTRRFPLVRKTALVIRKQAIAPAVLATTSAPVLAGAAVLLKLRLDLYPWGV